MHNTNPSKQVDGKYFGKYEEGNLMHFEEFQVGVNCSAVLRAISHGHPHKVGPTRPLDRMVPTPSHADGLVVCVVSPVTWRS